MTHQNIPIENQPFKFAYGLGLANDGTTPDELLTVNVGNCRDSNDVMDIKISTALTVTNLSTGLNGLDTGTVAANTLYSVWVIADSSGKKVSGALLSLASNALPLMPFEYDSFRRVGFVATDGTSDFLAFLQHGKGVDRVVRYDAPISVLAAGAQAAYTAIALTASVPAVANTPVALNYAYTNNAASDVFALTPGNGTGDAFSQIGQVAGVVMTGQATVMATVTAAVPEVDYKVSAGTVDVLVAGYTYSV